MTITRRMNGIKMEITLTENEMHRIYHEVHEYYMLEVVKDALKSDTPRDIALKIAKYNECLVDDLMQCYVDGSEIKEAAEALGYTEWLAF